MTEWYIPNICIDHSGSRNIIYDIKYNFQEIDDLKKYIKNEYNVNLHNKYKFICSGINFNLDINGFDINSCISYIKKISKNDLISKNNISIHFQYKEYNFYYPRIYEEVIQIIFKDDNVKIYTMNQFWIKNIIE